MILMAMIKWIPFYPVIFFILLVLSSLCIWCFAPVETENNPLDSLEKKIYRRRSRAVLLAEIVASLLLFTFTRYQIAVVIVLALFTEAIMLLYGILTQPRKSN
ncbi:MAG: accessory gene regulator B family protein [Ruminococcus sp.]|nr:accessory gene regulator B family protein [Ruminococcus sp.]